MTDYRLGFYAILAALLAIATIATCNAYEITREVGCVERVEATKAPFCRSGLPDVAGDD